MCDHKEVGEAEVDELPEINGASQNDFFNSPNTVDFVTRYNNAVISLFENKPEIQVGKIIEGAYAVVYVDETMVESALSGLSTNLMSVYPTVMGLLSREALEASGISQVQRQPYLDLHGQGVLLGFVDTGIDYVSNAFRYEDGSTKIKYIWDQSIAGAPPDTFNIGTEYTEEIINMALRSEDPYSLVPHVDTEGHGTFLASVAGSREPGLYTGAAPDSDMIVVKLRKANRYHLERNMVPPEQENAFSSADVMLGVEYIVDKALQLGMPIAICIGLGSNSGSHDGFSILEEFLTRVANRNGVALCVAAGNEVLANHHAQGMISGTDSSDEVEVLAANGSDISIQIWTGASDRISVSVMSPSGELLERSLARSGSVLEKSYNSGADISVQYNFPLPGSGNQLTWIKIRNPTDGVWRITIYGDAIVEGTYNAWLPMTGFVDPNVVFLDSEPECTITVPATAMGIITVGGYSSRTGSLYSNSSWGPTRLPALSPDLCAPGVDVSGIVPGGYEVRSGTSISAAVAAGACALMLQWGIVEGNEPSLNTYLIRSYLIRGCRRDSGIAYPNVRWGYGKLDLYNAFVQLMGGY